MLPKPSRTNGTLGSVASAIADQTSASTISRATHCGLIIADSFVIVLRGTEAISSKEPPSLCPTAVRMDALPPPSGGRSHTPSGEGGRGARVETHGEPFPEITLALHAMAREPLRDGCSGVACPPRAPFGELTAQPRVLRWIQQRLDLLWPQAGTHMRVFCQ